MAEKELFFGEWDAACILAEFSYFPFLKYMHEFHATWQPLKISENMALVQRIMKKCDPVADNSQQKCT